MTRHARNAERNGRRTASVVALILALTGSPVALSAPLDDTLRALVPDAVATASFDALDSPVTALLDRALLFADDGDDAATWTALREAGDLAGFDHPRVYAAGGEAAERLGDALRATLLRRRAHALDPSDTRNRDALARLLANGAPHDNADIGVLASTLLDPAEPLDESQRSAMLNALRERLLAVGNDGAARVVGRELVALPGDRVTSQAEQRPLVPERFTLEEAITAVESDPLDVERVVTKLLRGGGRVDALEERCDAMEPTPAIVAIRAHLLCESGRARRADGAIRNQLALTPGHPALIVSRTRTLRLMGDYEALRTLGAARGTDTPEELELGALLMSAGGDDARAYKRAVSALDATPRENSALFARRSMLCAEIAVRRRAYDNASEHLLESHLNDPDDPATLAALIELHDAEGPSPNPERHTLGASRLLQIETAAHESELLRARAAVRRGYADIAEDLLARLVQHRPDDALATRALVELWAGSGRADEAIRWLEERLDERPGLSGHRVLLCELYNASGDTDRAGRVLDEWYSDHPGDEVVALRLERLLRERAGAAQQADRLALRRLRRYPETIESLLERTLLAARIGDPDDIKRELDLALPRLNDADADLGNWGTDLVTRLVQIAARQRRGSEFNATALIHRLHAELDVLPPEAEQTALMALAARHANAREVYDAFRVSMSRHPEEAGEFTVSGAGVMLANTRNVSNLVRFAGEDEAVARSVEVERAAITISLCRLAVDDALGRALPSFADDAGAQAASITGRALRVLEAAGGAIGGPGSDGRAIADAFLALDPDAQRAVLYFRLTDNASDPAVRGTVIDEQLALAAHDLTRAFPGAVDIERSDALSLLGLRIDPNNALIANDFGYRLAERGVQLDEAERLTRLAVASAPTSASYLDSLGWVLYKQRRLEDEDGQPGAITLLGRAFALAQQGDTRLNAEGNLNRTAVLGDHYGDALWAHGRSDEALDAWESAYTLMQELLKSFDIDTSEGAPDPRAIYPTLLAQIDLYDALQAKLDAIDADAAPPIAPFGSDD